MINKKESNNLLPIASAKTEKATAIEMNRENALKSELTKEIFDSETTTTTTTMTTTISKQNERESVPEPRSQGRIEIKFTPRVCPTPSRESTDEKEKEVFTILIL